MPAQNNTAIPGLSLRKVLGLSSIYGITPILDRVLSLAFLPIFTRYLTPNAYGSLILLYAFGSIVQLVLFMGFPDSLQKLYWDYKGEERKEFLGTAWLFNLFVNAALLVPLFCFSNQISQYFLQNTNAALLLMLVMAKLFFATQSIVPYVVFRAEEKKAKILSVNLVSIIVRTGLTALFLIVFKMDLLGIFLADICASVATLFIYLPALRKMASFRFKGHYLRAIFKLAPFQFTVEILAWVISLSDRLIIQYLLKTPAEVGIYSIGYTFGSAVLFIVKPLYSAWCPHVYSVCKVSPEEYGKQMGEFFTFYFYACVFAFITISLLSRDFICFLTPATYHRAGSLVNIILYGQIFAAISNYFIPNFFLKTKMQLIAVVYLVSAIVNVVLNYILITRYGIIGAAYATLVAYFIMCVMIFALSQNIGKMRLEYRSIISSTLYAIIIYYGISSIKIINPIYAIISKSILIAIALMFALMWIKRGRNKKSASNMLAKQ